MPVIKSAIKKLRQDKKAEKKRSILQKQIDRAVSQAKKLKTEAVFKKAQSMIDRGVKNKLFHKNKAARLKSQLTKIITNIKPIKKRAALIKPVKKIKVQLHSA